MVKTQRQFVAIRKALVIFKKTRRKGQKVMILSQLIDWSHNCKFNKTAIVCANDILNQFRSEMNFLDNVDKMTSFDLEQRVQNVQRARILYLYKPIALCKPQK